jgi:hypothetical protein
MTNPLQGYHIHFDELVAENTVVLRRATYDFIVARYDAICASEPTALPDTEGDALLPDELLASVIAADHENPATEIHEDDELSINNAEPESVDKHDDQH